MQTLWIVSEQSPGHDSQSLGLGEVLAERLGLAVVRVVGRVNARGWQRGLIKRRMGKAGRALPQSVLDRYFEIDVPADSPEPDLIVSSGGKSVLCARTWAELYGARFVYLGEQKRFPDGWFDVIVSPIVADPRPNAIVCEIVPTPVSPKSVGAAAAEFVHLEGRLWTMVIGGQSRSQLFDTSDWGALARGMNHLAARHGVRWLITTSRRTGADAELTLKQNLDAQHIADAIWWSQQPRRQLHAFLGLCECAFVTLDSVTMISEAVASGRPVVAIHATDQRIKSGSFLGAMYENLVVQQRIVKLGPTQLAGFDPDAATFQPIPAPIMHGLVDRIIAKLGLTPAAEAGPD